MPTQQIVISCPHEFQSEIPEGFRVIQLFWKTGDDGRWWDMWQQRVEKTLLTAVNSGDDVEAYCIFGAGHLSSQRERAHVRELEQMHKFRNVKFTFTHIDKIREAGARRGAGLGCTIC